MSNITNRRRNYRLFEYLVSAMSDAELRTMRECVSAEWSFRVSRVASRQHMAAEPAEPDELEEGEELTGPPIGQEDMTQAETPQALRVQRRPANATHPVTGQPLVRKPSGVRRATGQ